MHGLCHLLQLCFPHGVAVSSQGEIIVADTLNSRVCIFSGLSSSWEGGGRVRAIDASVACLPMTSCIPRSDPALRMQTAQASPTFVCNSTLCIRTTCQIMKTYTGTTIMCHSENMPQHTSFSYPLGVAISKGGDALVSDWKSNRLLWLGIDGYPKVRGDASSVLCVVVCFASHTLVSGVMKSCRSKSE